jgi:hypothetical protein
MVGFQGMGMASDEWAWAHVACAIAIRTFGSCVWHGMWHSSYMVLRVSTDRLYSEHMHYFNMV